MERVREAMRSLRDARGYVLPHRGLLAAALPHLHETYGAMYRALTLEEGGLPPLQRECVWLAILAACDEGVGTHHVALFREHGGSDDLADAVFRQTGWAMGVEAHAFLPKAWAPLFPGLDAARSYLDGAAALNAGSPLPDATARLLRLSVHAARGNLWGLRVELEASYAARLEERAMAEAMSLIIWPRGVNAFVRAADIWLQLLRSGCVTPSPLFAAWAEASGQGPLMLTPGA
ncbi:hypothetical protein EBE87_18385 [Pseudoroseomonas wenyumeiae]|uniref:Carboxymuconolactone decarboxylase-like domain-containing protein n=1 Tax=Teichococcus wenyumeiae TaxID=2478470 RepID=A0ABX9VHT3_9PROT|nr:hypothetical protein EBE87_18385 [Pseudoroseomonas wenyumeiae]